MARRSFLYLLAPIATLLVSTSLAAAATRMVAIDKDDCPAATYSSIQSAVDASSPGDVIQVCPGRYREQIEITKPLTLVGVPRQGSARVILQPTALTKSVSISATFAYFAVLLIHDTAGVRVFNISVDGSKVRNVQCAPPGFTAVLWNNASGVFDHNAVYGTFRKAFLTCGNGEGISLNNTSGTSNEVTVSNNAVHDITKNGIEASGEALTVNIAGNTIEGIGPSNPSSELGIVVAFGPGGSITGNTLTFATCGTLSVQVCNYNAGAAILVRQAAAVMQISGNRISKSPYGIFVDSSSGESIKDNYIDDSDFAGITDLSTGDLIAGNSLRHMVGTAIDTSPATSAVVSGNVINDAAIGVTYAAGTSFGENTYYNTTVVRKKL
jgi:parallel beta-helix repeat protein